MNIIPDELYTYICIESIHQNHCVEIANVHFRKLREVDKKICSFLDNPRNLIAIINNCHKQFNLSHYRIAKEFKNDGCFQYISVNKKISCTARIKNNISNIATLIDDPFFDPHYSYKFKKDVSYNEYRPPVHSFLNSLCNAVADYNNETLRLIIQKSVAEGAQLNVLFPAQYVQRNGFSHYYSPTYHETVLNLAIRSKKYNIAQLLVQYGAHIDCPNNCGETLLEELLRHEYDYDKDLKNYEYDQVEKILQLKADVSKSPTALSLFIEQSKKS